MPAISIENDFSRLTVLPESGQILQWVFRGRKIFYEGSSPKRSGVPILFPFAGPLENNIFAKTGKEIPQHGFGRDTNWKVEKNTDSIILKLTNHDLFEEMKIAYPYSFEVEIKLTIELQKLFYQLTVKNLGEKEMPVAPGIHPYFPVIHNHKVDFQINNLPGFEAEEVNWKNFKKEIFFDFKDSVLVVLPNAKMLEIAEESDVNDFENLVVWSQHTGPGIKDYNFICVEPFTRKNNELNTNPILIKPKTNWSKTIVFTAFE